MKVDKPPWVEHEGKAAIYAIDTHPDGSRFATAGGDHKVKVWALAPVRDAAAERDGAHPRLLASLADHFGPVNVVRFSPCGRYVASGGDDHCAHVRELRTDAPPQQLFGEVQNVENWAPLSQLRGHAKNIMDLAWAPPSVGARLATCSLDNAIVVWDAVTGQNVATLKGHESFVKGVAWDPIGTYFASQADDRSVAVWRTEDWQMVDRIEEPFTRAVPTTFSMRLGWSPDGKALTCTNSFQQKVGTHTAPVLCRGDWSCSHSFVGHKAPVVVVRFSPKMFDRDGTLASCCAIGAQDCKITLWNTLQPQPVLVAQSFFEQSVLDVAWTPDGYSLLACSMDGTVAHFAFEPSELGEVASDEVVERMLTETYGDVRSRGAAIAEDPVLMQLEQQHEEQQQLMQSKQATPLKSPAPPAAPQPASPAQPQQEFRQSDGRRRIVPMAMGGGPAAQPQPAPARQAPVPQPAPVRQAALPPTPSAAAAPAAPHRVAPAPLAVGAAQHPVAASPGKRKAPEAPAGGQAPGLAATTAPGVPGIAVPEAPARLAASYTAEDEVVEVGTTPAPVVVEARNADGYCDVVCAVSGTVKWSDRIPSSSAVSVAAVPNFAAVGCSDGSVTVYSRAGRRLLAPLALEGAPVFLDARGERTLLAVSSSGKVRVMELSEPPTVTTTTTMESVLFAAAAAGTTVASVRLAAGNGPPLAVLANRLAFLYDARLDTWARVADGRFLRSDFASTLPPSVGGPAGDELVALQAAAAQQAQPAAFSAMLHVQPREQQRETSRHLETLLASAELLEQPADYKRWLGAYAKCLTANGEESRLRELCTDLVGPVSDGADPSWTRKVLGLEKRDLLRSVVLPAVATNRGMQRVAAEFVELLDATKLARRRS